MPIAKTCTVCGVGYATKKPASRFCSYKCRGLGTRGPDSPHYDREARVCLRCGISFICIKSRSVKLCSVQCRALYVSGDRHPNWTGGRWRTANGYIAVNLGQGRQMLEHRLVMGRILGRPILRGEVVHHRDGDKANNSPENLQLMTDEEHRKYESALYHSRVRLAGKKHRTGTPIGSHLPAEARAKLSRARLGYWKTRRQAETDSSH